MYTCILDVDGSIMQSQNMGSRSFQAHPEPLAPF